jgi:hypothetical protein
VRRLPAAFLPPDAQARGGGAHIEAHVGGFGGARIGSIGGSRRMSGFGGARIGGFGGTHIGAHVGGFGEARTGGIGGGRMSGFGGVRIGGFGRTDIGAHVDGFGGVRTGGISGGFGGARTGGFGGGHIAGIHRGSFGDGTGIHRGHFAVLAAPAFGQTATSNGYTGAYAPAPALGAVPNPPVGGPLPEAVTGPGLNIVGPGGVSAKTVEAVPCSTVAQETDGTTTCVGLQ